MPADFAVIVVDRIDASDEKLCRERPISESLTVKTPNE